MIVTVRLSDPVLQKEAADVFIVNFEPILHLVLVLLLLILSKQMPASLSPSKGNYLLQ